VRDGVRWCGWCVCRPVRERDGRWCTPANRAAGVRWGVLGAKWRWERVERGAIGWEMASYGVGGACIDGFGNGKEVADPPAQIEPPGLDLVFWAQDFGGRGWRGVRSGGRWCPMVRVVRVSVSSRVGGEEAHPFANRAVGARFCVLGAKVRWERVERGPIRWKMVSDSAGGAYVSKFASGRGDDAPLRGPSSQGSVFDWGWLSPPGIGPGSPEGGGDNVVSVDLYVS
jgi:hypothetical protein